MTGVAVSLQADTLQSRPEARDQTWFAELYSDTVGTAFALALRITRDSTLAEDAVADAYLRAWRSRSSLCTQVKAPAWVLSITRNCAIDAVRSRRDECDVTGISEPEETAPMESLIQDRDVGAIHAAFERLTVEQQQVISLRFFEELPHREVAKRMKRSANAIRQIQFRALSRMKKLLEAPVG